MSQSRGEKLSCFKAYDVRGRVPARSTRISLCALGAHLPRSSVPGGWPSVTTSGCRALIWRGRCPRDCAWPASTSWTSDDVGPKRSTSRPGTAVSTAE